MLRFSGDLASARLERFEDNRVTRLDPDAGLQRVVPEGVGRLVVESIGSD
jgi:hypothetical protein